MRVEIGSRRFTRSTDRKLELLRKASTEAQSRHGINGALKSKRRTKPITLPKVSCLEESTDE